MSKIFIPNKGIHDYSQATRYGKLVYLSIGKFKLLSIGRMYRTFEPELLDSAPDDWILIAGSTIMNVIACSMFAVKHGRLNLLIFSIDGKGDGQYKKRTIILEDRLESDKGEQGEQDE